MIVGRRHGVHVRRRLTIARVGIGWWWRRIRIVRIRRRRGVLPGRVLGSCLLSGHGSHLLHEVDLLDRCLNEFL